MSKSIFWSHMKRSGFLVFLSVFMIVLSAFASLALGKVIGHSVQGIMGGGVERFLFLAIVLFVIVLSMIVSLRSIFSGLLGMKITQGISLDLYKVLLKAKIEVVKRNASLIPIILSSDMRLLQNFFGSAAPVLLRNMITFLGSLVALFYTEKQLFFYLILAIPAFLIPLFLLGIKVRKLSSLVSSKSDNLHWGISESITNIQMIKAFLKEAFFLDRLESLSKSFSATFVYYVIVRSLFIGMVIAIAFFGVTLFVDFGVKSVFAGEIGTATLSEFIFFALFASTSIGRVMELYPDLRQFLNIYTRIENLYTEIVDSTEDEEVGQTVAHFEKLEFKNVCFSYHSDGADIVLNGLNFTINRGEKIAFVGPSGGGKSTIFALLLRFYFISSGDITINDISVSQLSPACIRALFAWVPQELSMISGDLEENICMQNAVKEEEKDRYQAICAAANIGQLPQDTKMLDLSRGQKQRINIARALFADREVVLLDEATSSLDACNEKDVDTIISDMSPNKTVIMVAHRFSSIRGVDKIIVMENGKVSAVGTHDELLSASAFYRQMAGE